jgi:O-methyltransferase involved in polyketide biosynthesis
VTEIPPHPKIDTTVPQTARVWNYWLGGNDNYEVDRVLGDQVEQAFPQIVEIARAQRAFLARAIRYLAGEAGIRQFLDVGTGLPTANNTHEVAQSVAPDARVVYVDNDPLVLVHARALLTSSPEGATDYIDADIRDVDAIRQQASRTLDFGKPIALSLLGILAHLDPYEEAHTTVTGLTAMLSSGSYLVVADSADTSEGIVEAARVWNQTAKPAYHVRTREQLAGYFDGLELVEPGLVSTPLWRPEPSPSEPPAELDELVGVARKP